MENLKITEKLSDRTQPELRISDVITRLSKMIDELDNKIINTDYDTIFNKDCDEDDLRCLKRTLEIFRELNV